MSNHRSISALAIFICAATAILSRHFGYVAAYGILKPATTILIIGVALMAFRETGSAFSRFVLIALVFALMGFCMAWLRFWLPTCFLPGR
jgi:hypothetical protein